MEAHAERIELLHDRFAAPGSHAWRILTVIAGQERKHARWVGELLAARGLPVAPSVKAERYWPQTLPGIRDLATGAAVGAHAEGMRLERIAAIAADEEVPADVREVFRRILPEERFTSARSAAWPPPTRYARPRMPMSSG